MYPEPGRPASAQTEAGAAARSGASARIYVLACLTLVYTLNIADRFVVSTVLEPIRLELRLTDAQTAFITGVALALFYVTLGIPIATLADRANRRNIVACSLAAWSLMTALCGQARSALQFMLARVGVGIGEAGGTPPSTSMLADHFSPASRPMVYTVYALGAPLGAWVGSQLAGGIAEHYGWRAAFSALGIPGLLVAALVLFTLREPRRGQLESAGLSAVPHDLATTVRYLLRHRSALHMIAAGTIATLWGWGLMWWTPTFLVRSHGMTVGEAGATLGPMHLIAGSLATVVTTVAVGPAVARNPRSVLRFMAVVIAVVTVPSVLVYLSAARGTAVLLLWTVVPAVYFFIGPLMGLLQNVTPPGMRAQTMAILVLTANIANLIVAPQLVGLASDWLAPHLGGNAEGLRWSLVVLAPTGFWAAWHFRAAMRTIEADSAPLAAPAPALAGSAAPGTCDS